MKRQKGKSVPSNANYLITGTYLEERLEKAFENIKGNWFNLTEFDIQLLEKLGRKSFGVDSITGAVLPSAANVSPTIVVKGYTVDEPTMRISLASATLVSVNAAKSTAANDFTIFISYLVCPVGPSYKSDRANSVTGIYNFISKCVPYTVCL